MEINFLELEASYEPEPNDLEELGEKILWANAIIAASAFIPALVKKKRVFTQVVLNAEVITAASFDPDLPEALQCTPEVKRKIAILWTKIDNGELGLDLWSIGNELKNTHQLHPFTHFLNLPKEKLQTIFNRNNWTDALARIPAVLWGFKEGMQTAKSRDKPVIWPDLSILIPPFATKMGKNQEAITRLIQADDWRGLVHYLFDIRPA